jgi:hypothetical protein
VVVLEEAALQLWEEAGGQDVPVTPAMLLHALRQTSFPDNSTRVSVMPAGVTSIQAFCMGLVGSRCGLQRRMGPLLLAVF